MLFPVLHHGIELLAFVNRHEA